jgi:cell division FtsZ-interacting protein ZapD
VNEKENESMEKSLEKFKHIERISRQTRHHQTFLNQIYDQKLHRELDHLTDEYEQSFIRSKTQQKLERQRKQVLDITIQQIAHERRIPTNIEQTLPKNNGK